MFFGCTGTRHRDIDAEIQAGDHQSKMIIEPIKVGFVKVPKCGSTSVADFFWTRYGEGGQVATSRVRNPLRELDAAAPPYRGWHSTFLEIQRAADDLELAYFSVTREPMSRLVSIYRWQHRKQLKGRFTGSFAEFVAALRDAPERLRGQAVYHARPQVSWLVDEAGEVASALHLYPLEDLDRCLARFGSMVGIEEFSVGRRNATTKQEATDPSLPTSLEQWVHERYADDFVLHERVRRQADAAALRG